MAGKIFINYRRGDDPGFVQALFARLEQAFPPHQLFMDVDNIEPGLDFVRVLNEQVAQCDVLISVIGRNWIEARDEAGARRIENPDDFVRIEIESALAQDKRVIPVLVGQATMPRADELPETMKPLTRRHAVHLSHERFKADIETLIAALKRVLKNAEEARAAKRAEGESEKVQSREPAEQERQTREGRIKLAALSVHGAPDGWFAPGAGKSEWFKDLDVGPEMVVVPAGSFLMGSPDTEQGRGKDESPQHRVTLAKPFAVGRFAVTFDEWDACVSAGGGTGYQPKDEGWGRGRRPVINVSWDDAKAYVDWLGRKTGKPYRLLSEAEWEYIARAGSTTPFWWGDSISTDQANYSGNYAHTKSTGSGLSDPSAGKPTKRTLAVNSFEPNPWGLYQIHGNVWEWTEDCWHDSYAEAPRDGSAWTSGDCSGRVLRGGSWINGSRSLRSAVRLWGTSNTRSSGMGFRIGKTLFTA